MTVDAAKQASVIETLEREVAELKAKLAGQLPEGVSIEHTEGHAAKYREVATRIEKEQPLIANMLRVAANRFESAKKEREQLYNEMCRKSVALRKASNRVVALEVVATAADRLRHAPVMGCLCCNPEACDSCPPCAKCAVDAALDNLRELTDGR